METKDNSFTRPYVRPEYPAWVANMAAEAGLSVPEYYRSPGYRDQVRGNMRQVARVASADVRATGGQHDSAIDQDNTPMHEGQ